MTITRTIASVAANRPATRPRSCVVDKHARLVYFIRPDDSDEAECLNAYATYTASGGQLTYVDFKDNWLVGGIH